VSDKPVFLFIASYDMVDDAKSDEQLVHKAYQDKLIGTYDAAILTKDDQGKVHVQAVEKPTEHGAEIGLFSGAGVGTVAAVATHIARAMIGLFSPPMILADAVVGTVAGGLIGHFRKGLPREDQEQLKKVLGDSKVALVVVAETDVKQALQSVLKRAKTEIEKQISVDEEQFKRDLTAVS
jgi:uncharacterized membrane protein